MGKIIALLGLALLASGCAGVATLPFSSFMNSAHPSNLEIHSDTQVKLTEANFVTVKTNVVGQSRGFALLGVITMVPARFQTAMNRLYLKSEMQPGKSQTLGNIVMEKTSSYWILFSIPRVYVRADVVEFVPNNATLIIPRVPGSGPPLQLPPPTNDEPKTGASLNTQASR